jgi:hypothetical protein
MTENLPRRSLDRITPFQAADGFTFLMPQKDGYAFFRLERSGRARGRWLFVIDGPLCAAFSPQVSYGPGTRRVAVPQGTKPHGGACRCRPRA